MKLCSVDGCERPVRTRRLMCEAHYYRTRRYGDPGSPHVGPRPMSERLAEKTDVTPGGCWLWTGYVMKSTGYGQIGVGQRLVLTHRASYEAHVGPIPRGLHVDHLCRVRRCINPDHLEAVTQAENNRRAAQYRGVSR